MESFRLATEAIDTLTSARSWRRWPIGKVLLTARMEDACTATGRKVLIVRGLVSSVWMRYCVQIAGLKIRRKTRTKGRGSNERSM